MKPADITALREHVAHLDAMDAEALASAASASAALDDAVLELAGAAEAMLAECRTPADALAALACSRDAWAVAVLDGWALTDGHGLLWARGVDRPDVRQIDWLAGRQGPTAAKVASMVAPWLARPPIASVSREKLAEACRREQDRVEVLTPQGVAINAALLRAFVLATGEDPRVLGWPIVKPQAPLACGGDGWLALVMPLAFAHKGIVRAWPESGGA